MNRKVAAGGTSGGGAGILLVWLLGYLGVSLTPELGATIALGLAWVGAFVWHHGLLNIARQILHGDRP